MAYAVLHLEPESASERGKKGGRGKRSFVSAATRTVATSCGTRTPGVALDDSPRSYT